MTPKQAQQAENQGKRMKLKHVAIAAKAREIVGEKHQYARDQLRLAVEDARQEGCTLAEIGETLGMTRQGVYDLLQRNGRKS